MLVSSLKRDGVDSFGQIQLCFISNLSTYCFKHCHYFSLKFVLIPKGEENGKDAFVYKEASGAS